MTFGYFFHPRVQVALTLPVKCVNVQKSTGGYMFSKSNDNR